MNEEYDPLTADLIERLFAASRKAANDEQDLLVEAADALEAKDAEIAVLRGQVHEWLAANAPGGWIDALRADAERLEWIEKRLFVRKWNGVIDGGSRIQWSIAGDFRHTTQRMVGHTFRAAVDAARGTA